jgi:hypothetical protein
MPDPEGLSERLAAAYEDGVEAERERWEKATGVPTAEQYELRSNVYPVSYVEHDGGVRLVRGYSNGRYGYWRKEEPRVFVDLEPPPGYWDKTPLAGGPP